MFNVIVALLVGLVLSLGALVFLVRRFGHAQRQLARSRETIAQFAVAKRNLMCHLGHEIRNPINAILGMADMILDERSLSADVQGNLHVIRGAANQLMMVATNLTALHVGDDQPIQEQRSEVSIPEVLMDVSQSLSASLLTRQLCLDVCHEIGAPRHVEADAQFLMLIIRNVLAYAIGKMKDGHITVTVHAPQSDTKAANNQLNISVADNGPPAAPLDDPGLFEAYGQNDPLHSSVEPGTGLNLAVARSLSRNLGGDLTWRHHPNAGNIFEISLPVVTLSVVTADDERPDDGVVRFNKLYVLHRQNVRSQRILVTEDQRSNQQLIHAILRKAGHEVTIASTGDEAIQHLREVSFDIGVMDLRLPGTSGLDVMRLTRVTSLTANRKLPFIVLTGETSPATRNACIEAGATAFLAKPISAQRLLDTIRTVVERVERVHPALTRTREEVAEFVDLASASLSPRLMAESMRDAVRYTHEATSACERGDFTTARQRLRAIRGTSHSMGATHLGRLCTRLLELDDEQLQASTQLIAEQLDKSVSGTQESLSMITHLDLD